MKMKKEAPVITRDGDGWKIPVEGETVVRCVFDVTFFRLLFLVGQSGIEISIENDFTLKVGDTTTLLSVQTPSPLREALALLRQTCQSAAIDAAGNMSLRFTGGLALNVQAHEKYEAWQIHSHLKLHVVCMPGGKLAIWDID